MGNEGEMHHKVGKILDIFGNRITIEGGCFCQEKGMILLLGIQANRQL